MYELKERTKKMIGKISGISYDELINMDYDAYKTTIDKDCKFTLENDERIIGRGNPLLSRGEFLTMDEVDEYLEALR